MAGTDIKSMNGSTGTSSLRKEDVLVEALPYIQRFSGATFVVKIGGVAQASEAARSVAEDVTLLRHVGIRVVLVHGGGREVTDLAARLGIETEFVDGQRVTNEAMRDVALSVLAGKLNKEIVAGIIACGGEAVGISGVDGATLAVADVIESLGLVGRGAECNPRLIASLLASGYLPVIAPLGVGADGTIYNINADVAASAVAKAMHAEKLIVLSDVPGVLVGGELVSTLGKAAAVDLIEQGFVTGGMIPKVRAAFETLDAGVKTVHMIDGRVPHALLLEIFTDTGIGTQCV
jgi:acetylglutamate kinase